MDGYRSAFERHGNTLHHNFCTIKKEQKKEKETKREHFTTVYQEREIISHKRRKQNRFFKQFQPMTFFANVNLVFCDAKQKSQFTNDCISCSTLSYSLNTISLFLQRIFITKCQSQQNAPFYYKRKQ